MAAGLLAAALGIGAGSARAQTNPGGSNPSPPPTPTPAQIEQAVKESGLSPAQLLEKARELQGAGKADTTSPPPAVRRSPASTETTPPAAEAPAAHAAEHGLEPFGYEIFSYSPTTFEPLTYGPVGPDYQLGPGDELVITVWGDDQLTLTQELNREGTVTLPEAGQVQLAGLTLEEARARLHAALSRVYSGLRPAGQRSTTFLQVSVGKLRSIQVFILGEVVRPGGYTVSSVSRILNALYAAGGPTRGGTLRDVQLNRGGRRVASLDLYEIILRGDASHEARLENGDVIFVPPVGRRIAVQGPVRRPGLFELAGDEQLNAVLRFAGGVLPTADVERAQIERVVPATMRDSLRGQDRVSIDVVLREVLDHPDRDLPLQDGDRLTVFSIGERRINTVVVSGHSVLKPGTFEYHEGMTVADLIHLAGGLTPDAFLERALITRTLPDGRRTVLRVDLRAALAGEGSQNLGLVPLDELAVSSIWDLRERYTVTVGGSVRRPGSYEYLEGMSLSDLLLEAGGLTDEAMPARAEVARVDSSTRAGRRLADTLTVKLRPGSGLLPEPSDGSSFPLQPHDAVFIRRDPDFMLQTYVTLSGEVKFPGAYALRGRTDRLCDVVRRAGGLTELAHPAAAVFTRPGAGRIAIDFPVALRNPRGRDNIVLHDGDALEVPRLSPVVTVEGAVRAPVSVLYRPGMGIGYYIEQASGFDTRADKRATTVVFADGSVRKKGLFGSPVPNAGSRIVVPSKPPPRETDSLKDVGALVSLMASAATMIYLIRQASP